MYMSYLYIQLVYRVDWYINNRSTIVIIYIVKIIVMLLQIEVHPELASILKEYTKAILKDNPKDILAFSADYFAKKGVELEKGKK